MAKLKVTLKRSLISRPETQRRTVRALGLHKINSTSILPDDPCVRGQIFKVKHLVAVEEVEDVESVKKVDTSKKEVKATAEETTSEKLADKTLSDVVGGEKLEDKTLDDVVDGEKLADKTLQDAVVDEKKDEQQEVKAE